MSTKRFFIDFLSLVSIHKPVRILGFIKMLRVVRLTQYIRNMKVAPSMKTFFKLLKLVLFLFLYVHVVGCFMWYVIKIKKDDLDYDGRPLFYIPPLNYVSYTETEIFSSKCSDLKRYLLCLYYGLLILGVGSEMGPVN
jgi:hypothetical protein